MKKYNKYGNSKVIVDGFKFDSKKESKRYQDLRILLKAGKIENLELQPRFLLQEKFIFAGKAHRKIEYIADFQYLDIERKIIIIEDVKGFKTEVYKIKKKLLLMQLAGFTKYEFNEL